jgi:hypothetical protein
MQVNGTSQGPRSIVCFRVNNTEPLYSTSTAFQTLSIHTDIKDDIHKLHKIMEPCHCAILHKSYNNQ